MVGCCVFVGQLIPAPFLKACSILSLSWERLSLTFAFPVKIQG